MKGIEIRVFRRGLLAENTSPIELQLLESGESLLRSNAITPWTESCEGKRAIFWNDGNIGFSEVIAEDGTPFEMQRAWTEPFSEDG